MQSDRLPIWSLCDIQVESFKSFATQLRMYIAYGISDRRSLFMMIAVFAASPQRQKGRDAAVCLCAHP